MKYPTLVEQEASRQMVDTFGGYNHTLRIGDGEFFDMKNMTSDYYPVLAPRKKRGVYASPSAVNGLIAKDALCYVDGAEFVIGDERINLELTAGPKTLTSMGAYVIILPDKKWINTKDLTKYGDVEASFENTEEDVTFNLCTVDGASYNNTTVSPSAPSNPANKALWIDTSSTPHALKQYSADNGVWSSIATTYVKISSPGIGANFKQYDGVEISGVISESLQDINSNMVIWACDTDYIVVVGIIDEVATQTVAQGKIKITRKMPPMDFLIESENRLWGCRYGAAANGEMVNEIYSSKLGDFKNWNCFMGLSTDSYAASCGTDGPFTGAITHLGYPLFFKETCVHKVYGNYPANFQIQTTACRGVQKGCERSLAIVNEVLFYKAQSGICAYDGSLPVEMSSALGELRYDDAAAGAYGNKYYISMRDAAGAYCLFVYDTAKGMWHKEDDLHTTAFCPCRGELYAISDGKIITMLGSGTPNEADIDWMVQTGEIGMSSPDMKYLSRLTVRMALDIGSEICFFAQYDFSDEWKPLYSMKSTDLRSFSLPIRPIRCDHMKLRIEGKGNGRIYSITKTMEQGSELS